VITKLLKTLNVLEKSHSKLFLLNETKKGDNREDDLKTLVDF